MGNSAKCVVQSVISVINGCCSKCNFAYMKTKIILAALMVVGVLSGKTEKTMNETLNQKQQALVAVAACEAKDDQKTLERILDDAFERGVLTVNEAKETLSQLYAYTGFPRSLNALASLQKVVRVGKACAALASGRRGQYPCRGEALARCCSRLVVSAYCNRCPG